MAAKTWVEEMGCKVYYGDSVAEYSPVLIRKNNANKHTEQIRHVMPAHLFKPYVDLTTSVTTKEIAVVPEGVRCEVWSWFGWTRVLHVIRHQTNKKMYRVITSNNNSVDVTEDHSLLDHNHAIIRPTDVKIGETKLLTCYGDGTVTSVLELPQTDAYVYDLETADHTFAVGDIVVHNTDSLYISMPEENFVEVDKAFYTEKIDKKTYWTDLVNLSFASMNDSAVARGIVSRINKKFLDDNGTEFLKMAYEEFLWPVLFAARKKYIGIDHKHIVNFKPDKLFIRGFEIKKRGTSEFLKKVFGDIKGSCGITSKIFSFDNLYSVMELCLLAIDDIYAHPEQFKFEDFIQTAEYRAEKKNTKVIEFRNRMAHTNTPVKAGERFEYVITRRHPYKYDTRGRKSKLKIGERMEFLDTARTQDMQIDIDHYMHGSVNGQLARLIVYEPQFEVMPLEDNESEIKIADDKTYQNAVKFIKQYASRYYTEYADVGGVYKSMYRHVNAQFQTCIKSGVGLDADLVKLMNCDYLNEDTNSPDWIFTRAEKDAAAAVPIAIGNDFISLQILGWENIDHFESEAHRNQCIRKYIGKIDELHLRYVSNPRRGFKTERMIATEVRDVELARLKAKYTDMQASIAGLYSSHDASLRNAIEACKRGANISAEVFQPIKNGDDKKIVVEMSDIHTADNEINSYVDSLRTNKKLRKAWQGLRDFYAEVYNAHLDYYSVERICEALTAIKNKTINYVARPENIAQVIREDVRNDAKDLPDELFDM
jgi:intein/homing endonuclease